MQYRRAGERGRVEDVNRCGGRELNMALHGGGNETTNLGAVPSAVIVGDGGASWRRAATKNASTRAAESECLSTKDYLQYHYGQQVHVEGNCEGRKGGEFKRRRLNRNNKNVEQRGLNHINEREDAVLITADDFDYEGCRNKRESTNIPTKKQITGSEVLNKLKEKYCKNENEELKKENVKSLDINLNNLAAEALKLELLGEKEESNKVQEILKKEKAIVSIISSSDEDNRKILEEVDAQGQSRHMQKILKDIQDAKTCEKNEPNLYAMALEEKIGKTPLQSQTGKWEASVHRRVNKGADIFDEINESQLFSKRNKIPRRKGDSEDFIQAIKDKEKLEKLQGKCRLCTNSNNFAKYFKDLIVHYTEKSVIVHETRENCLCPAQLLCFPLEHSSNMAKLDEETKEKIYFQKQLIVNCFKKLELGAVFCEIFNNDTYNGGRHEKHCHVEVYPIPLHLINMAETVFKKSIIEGESEWVNQKNIEKYSPSVGPSMPGELPYIAVEFGCTKGIAHVIEESANFPKDFCKSIISGILGVDILYQPFANDSQLAQSFDLVLNTVQGVTQQGEQQ